MQEYEVIRETYNACAGCWWIDDKFTREIETDDIESVLKTWFHGELPPHEVNRLEDGTIVYVILPQRLERYSFSAF